MLFLPAMLLMPMFPFFSSNVPAENITGCVKNCGRVIPSVDESPLAMVLKKPYLLESNDAHLQLHLTHARQNNVSQNETRAI